VTIISRTVFDNTIAVFQTVVMQDGAANSTQQKLWKGVVRKEPNRPFRFVTKKLYQKRFDGYCKPS
jgi:hypothetical protein